MGEINYCDYAHEPGYHIKGIQDNLDICVCIRCGVLFVPIENDPEAKHVDELR